MFALLSKRLEEGYLRGDTGFILHGIPRTRFQAVSFFSNSVLKLLLHLIEILNSIVF